MSESKPFLKWAGGKTQLLSEIEGVFPIEKTEKFNFVEPFVGSGAVLFWVLNRFPNVQKVVVNDFNSELVNVYRVVTESVDALISRLSEWQAQYETYSDDLDKKKAYYYEKRSKFNSRENDELSSAALFIFLNRTCFNGLYRVNRKNEFNVPMGSYKCPRICDAENLRAVSEKLQKVTLLNCDFWKTLEYVDSDSIVYLDPPYKPLSTTSSFNSYSHAEFGDDEQIRLKKYCDEVTKIGGKWILSNSDVRAVNPKDKFFDDLYSRYNIQRVLARRNINSNSTKRGKLSELLISNFETPSLEVTADKAPIQKKLIN